MPGNQTEVHHIIPRGLRNLLANFGIDVNTYAWNSMLLPNNRTLSQSSGLPQHGFLGNHTRIGYTGGAERALRRILSDSSLSYTQQQARVRQFMNALRLAIMRGDVDMFGPTWLSAKNRRFFSVQNLDPNNPNSYFAQNASALSALDAEKVTHTSSTPPVCGDQTQRRTRLQ
jgi:hypothetical protein